MVNQDSGASGLETRASPALLVAYLFVGFGRQKSGFRPIRELA